MATKSHEFKRNFRGDKAAGLHVEIEKHIGGEIAAHEEGINGKAPNDFEREHKGELVQLSCLKSVAEERVIGWYSSGLPGPLILAVSGIHGNEPSGPRAIKAFLEMLQTRTPLITGTFLGLLGNIKAGAANQRYLDKDLNRCFLPKFISPKNRTKLGAEAQELNELVHILHELKKEYDDICFIDCHTTSARTMPYLSVNPHPESLQLANRFPLNNVIGLQQGIRGCFAEYCNKLNFRGFTFEAGQHLSAAAFSNQVAMLWLMLVYTGALLKQDLETFRHYELMLSLDTPARKRIYRLLAHYRIKTNEKFVMKSGFENFDHVEKETLLATNRYGDIVAFSDGYLLMPLYQEQGDDGFFLLEEENELP
jgi:succinylglutamate desuccinylase